MKLFLIVWIMVFMSAAVLNAQDRDAKQKQITVLGSVELKENADQASLSFSVKGVGPSLRKAVDDANKKTETVTRKLIELGVSSKNITIASFYSGENIGDKAFLSSSRDFKANISTLIRVDSLSILESVLFVISESEIESISDIRFGLKDELGFRRRARIAAAEKAKEKAQEMVVAVGATLGNIISIDEFQPTMSIGSPVFLRGGRSEGPNPFNPTSVPPQVDEIRGTGYFAQTISITSQVRASFEIK